MRYIFYRLLIYIGLGILGLGLFNVQVIQGRRYRDLSEKNRIRLLPMEAPRGRVFDRRGNLLATNRPAYDVVATPEDITKETALKLAELLDLTEEQVWRRIDGPRESPFSPAVVQDDISRELLYKIEEKRPELPGVDIRVTFLRHYPYNETASHLIGYIGKINAEEYYSLSDRTRYGMTSLIGRSGIERIYDERLRGWRGARQIEVNARGKMIRLMSEKIAVPGEDLTVTLDLEFQQKLMELIEGKNASVMVLDLEKDDLIAVASSPAFDPNVFVEPGKSKERMAVIHDKASPLVDRGVQSAYPPGSVFKLVTAIAALETGKISPMTRFHCNGKFRLNKRSRAFKCWNAAGHGSLNLYEAIERSCNVYFYNLGAILSADQISRYAHELGLGEPLKFEIASATEGLVPDIEWKRNKYNEKWYQGDTLSFAIGQSYLLTSPIQILRLSGIIAKDGDSVEPHLLANEETDKKKQRKNSRIHKENFKVLKRAMLNVVQSDFGTGQLARVDFDKLAAKTGTAQVPPKKSHGWMTGFFPYDDPKIAFVVFVEHGGSGGLVGAEIVKGMLKVWGEMNVPQVV